MPSVKLCAFCNGHGATTYGLLKAFSVPEIQRPSGPFKANVHAGAIDLCDNCWTAKVNKRTLTLEGVEQRIGKRRSAILARAARDPDYRGADNDQTQEQPSESSGEDAPEYRTWPT